MAEQTGFPLPGNIRVHTDTILAFDNIDRLENTLSGGGTSHTLSTGLPFSMQFMGYIQS